MGVTSPATTSALGSYEPSLDGLRGVCIASVVAYHACAQARVEGWVRGGFIGVSVFFTLSGFLITSLLMREHARAGCIDLSTFWARRIRRLVPASLAVVVAVIALSAAGPLSVKSSDALAATWSVTNWHVIGGGQARLLQTIVGPLGPTWSLAVEEQFYVVLALLVAVAVRLPRPRRTLAAVAAVGVLVPTVLANVVSDWHPTLEFNTLLRVPELFTGVLLALWLGGAGRHGEAPRIGDLAAAAGLAVLVGLFFLVDYDPPWLLRGGYTVVAIVTAVVIAGLLQHGRVPVLLARQPLRWLGTISYSLYLVHWPVMSVLTPERAGLNGASLAIVLVAAAVAAGWMLHLVVERPLRRVRTTSNTTFAAGALAVGVVTALSLVLL